MTLAADIGRVMRERPGCDFDQLCADLPRYSPSDIGSCLMRILVQAAADLQPPHPIAVFGGWLHDHPHNRWPWRQ